MIPIKHKKYMINCQGPYDYNCYMGEGVFTGEVTDIADETCYGFIIPICGEVCFFVEEEIVAEFTDNNQVRPLICGPENCPEDSNYCETCGGCGETGCCPPINCQAVKCKYGEINLKDYECTLKQWEIMHKALRAIHENNSNTWESSYAADTLNAVDKEWDKLYSKENHELRKIKSND